MPGGLISDHSTAIIQGLIKRVESIKSLDHSLTKGELRELFVSKILKLFLTNQFDIGSGFIINQDGIHSKQTDIIIYDNRILPPFINEYQIGIYPAQCVVGTIEIKSWLSLDDILKTVEDIRYLYDNVYDVQHDRYNDFLFMKPICSVFGFWDNGIKTLLDESLGREWLINNAHHLFGICMPDNFCWLLLQNGWTLRLADENNEETKRFIAVLLDNIRREAQQRLIRVGHLHRDWMSQYIRE